MPNAARFWDRFARRYAARPVGDTAGYERTLERTRHYMKPTDAAIEFGCGSGTTADGRGPDSHSPPSITPDEAQPNLL